MTSALTQLLGLHTPVHALSWSQMGARTLVVFIFGLVLVRLADRRFLGRNAGFDILLAFVLGSVLSRAINGQAPFFKSLGASALLVLLHRIVAYIACRWPPFSKLIKGEAVILVKNGQPDQRALHALDISEDDLAENLRLNANLGELAEVAEARLERNGQIGVVKGESR
jgi:uncharacterized membrane protein YcaP (DUF421 family)